MFMEEGHPREEMHPKHKTGRRNNGSQEGISSPSNELKCIALDQFLFTRSITSSFQSNMPPNRAAWQDKAGTTLCIRQTPYPTTLKPGQMVVKPQAWAINPCNALLQDTALPFIQYPLILGEDISGGVMETGNAVSRFKPGDRVLAFAQGAFRGAAMGGFQEHVIVEEGVACHVPEWMSFVQASVFPLCFTTAAQGLFNKDFLALPRPEIGIEANSAGKSVLIWGGASAVGANAIQLARAAGLEVLTTASPQNFEYVKGLGVSCVFDYRSETAMEEIVAALDRSACPCAGIFQAAGADASLKPCLEIAKEAKGNIPVVTTTPVADELVPEGVSAKMVFGDNQSDILPIWKDFLPSALARREYVVAPEPEVVQGKGLEGIQEGLDVLKKGVSAKKVVVSAD